MMSTVLLNALASTAGGGLTYLRNVLPRLARADTGFEFIALLPPERVDEYRGFVGDQIDLVTVRRTGTLARLWWEQTGLRTLIHNKRVDLLVALGNFALFDAPVPQIVLSRNDLYFSPDFERDLRHRRLYTELATNRMKRWLALKSIKIADINVTPSNAFRERLTSLNGQPPHRIEVIPFGFDPVVFRSDPTPLEHHQLEKLKLDQPYHRVLFVSHYNYFRNFETLIRAIQHLPDDVLIVLTTDIRRGAIYGGYDATAAADLIDDLGVRDRIAMLGEVPYSRLHHVYQLCDAFVCPSYSESFGHPLVEAMASGLPVIAANLAIHREMCGDAAVYFDVFDASALAEGCKRVLNDKALADRLKASGNERSKQFSWDTHVESLLRLMTESLSAERMIT